MVEVVSIGVNHTFKVIFTPLEYIPTMSKIPHFFGSGFLLFHPTSSILLTIELTQHKYLPHLGRNQILDLKKYIPPTTHATWLLLGSYTPVSVPHSLFRLTNMKVSKPTNMKVD